MTVNPAHAFIGKKIDDISVRLSYKIVELFSEGLYTSPNKAIEELVANSFDAGAQKVQVILSPNLHSQDAMIAVIDDGVGMDQDGLKQHWFIGISNKRKLEKLPLGRKQIGKFGIGKLSTYVLANRLTHISKRNTKYYSTSMDYRVIDRRVEHDVEPKAPIKIELHELNSTEAEKHVEQWLKVMGLKTTPVKFFGDESSNSWTISIMSALKPKVHDIRPKMLQWILRTALPLRPDFGIWLNNEKLKSSKEEKNVLKKWIIGKDLVDLSRLSPQGITKSDDKSVSPSHENRFGLNVPELGRVTGYAEAYKDLLTGKSDEIGRSHGFFVYVHGRLLNVVDGHFGIAPNEFKHGTFGRFRLVVNIDGLDDELRSNRETVSEGRPLAITQNLLRAIFYVVHQAIEAHDRDEEPGAQLARKLAASPSSITRMPIIELARAVVENRAKTRYLKVPNCKSADEREKFLSDLVQRSQKPEIFVTGVIIDSEQTIHDGIVRFDTSTGVLQLNELHPFVATFYDEFRNKKLRQPLEMFAMAEVLAEAHLHSIDVNVAKIDEFLLTRDQILRHLANESGRQSSLSIANALSNARNDPNRLEECVCDAFRSLGFEVRHIGKSGKPDGIATANLSVDDSGIPRSYKISLEAKSKEKDTGKVSAKDVDLSAVIRHRDQENCDHAVVIGQAFPSRNGNDSALGKSIEEDRRGSKMEGKNRTITLITVDDLSLLVRLRPVKQVGLKQIRKLFKDCSLPDQSASWVKLIHKVNVKKPPYRNIVKTIEYLQKKFDKAAVKYSALRVELSHLNPPITYESDDDLMDLCKGMYQMAPYAIWADSDKVELDQSADNVIDLIETAMQES